MVTQKFTVPGMSCGHCEASVREEVGEIAGVTGVVADRHRDYVAVTSENGVDDAAIIAAIDEAGYSATAVK